MTKSGGRSKACQRFNVDQLPLPFAVDTKHTYEIVRPCSKVWVAQPRSGLNNWRTTERTTTYCCYFPRARKENC